jgi:hypothetical protein
MSSSGAFRREARSRTDWSSREGSEGLTPVAARTLSGPSVSNATLRTSVESIPAENAMTTLPISLRMDWRWAYFASSSGEIGSRRGGAGFGGVRGAIINV